MLKPCCNSFDVGYRLKRLRKENIEVTLILLEKIVQGHYHEAIIFHT